MIIIRERKLPNDKIDLKKKILKLKYRYCQLSNSNDKTKGSINIKYNTIKDIKTLLTYKVSCVFGCKILKCNYYLKIVVELIILKLS